MLANQNENLSERASGSAVKLIVTRMMITRINLPDPYPPELDEDHFKACLRDFRAALSFPAVQEFGCAVCARRCQQGRTVKWDSKEAADETLIDNMQRVLSVHSMPSANVDRIMPLDQQESILLAGMRVRATLRAAQPPEFLIGDTSADVAMLQAIRDLRRPKPLPVHTVYGIVLDPCGLDTEAGIFWICRSCETSCVNLELPPESIANDNFIGQLPAEFQDISLLEELIVSPFRTRNVIFKCVHWLAGKGSARYTMTSGNVITTEQDLKQLFTSLPWLIRDAADCVTVVLVSATMPDPKNPALLRHLRIRRRFVHRLLLWFSANNAPWAARCQIDSNALAALPEDGIPPEIWDRVILDKDFKQEARERSGYASSVFDSSVPGGSFQVLFFSNCTFS